MYLNTKGCSYVWYYLIMKCLSCGKALKPHQQKYCSNICQHDSQYKDYIKDWKKGGNDGNRGVKTKLLSKHIRRYILEKYNSKCSKCNWSKKHPITKVVPLEIDHIDGDAMNNIESNLQLLCPNCHALTPHFRNLNRGNGRKNR